MNAKQKVALGAVTAAGLIALGALAVNGLGHVAGSKYTGPDGCIAEMYDVVVPEDRQPDASATDVDFAAEGIPLYVSYTARGTMVGATTSGQFVARLVHGTLVAATDAKLRGIYPPDEPLGIATECTVDIGGRQLP